MPKVTDAQSLLIDSIIDEFNFESVYIAMTALDWKWAVEDGDSYVMQLPSIARLKRSARRLLVEATTEEAVSCGGFEAKYSQLPDASKEYYELKFVLSETDNYE